MDLLKWRPMLEKAKQHVVQGSKPQFLALGGGSGVGKGVCLRMLQENNIVSPSAIIITPELIRELDPTLAEGQLIRHPEKSPENIARYCELRDALVEDCLKAGVSVVLDDHCKNVARITTLMKKVDACNAETALVGIFINPHNYVDTLIETGVRHGTADFDFMIDSAQAFATNHPKIRALFQTSILLENKWTDVQCAAQHTTHNGIETEVFLDEQVYQRFQTSPPITRANAEAKAAEHEGDAEGRVATTLSGGAGGDTQSEKTQPIKSYATAETWAAAVRGERRTGISIS